MLFRLTWTEATGNGSDYREVRMEEEVWAGDRETARMARGYEHREGEFFRLFWQLEEAGCCPDFEPVSYGPNLKTEKRWKRDGWLRSPESRSGWEPRYLVEDVPFQCGCDMCLGIEK